MFELFMVNSYILWLYHQVTILRLPHVPGALLTIVSSSMQGCCLCSTAFEWEQNFSLLQFKQALSISLELFSTPSPFPENGAGLNYITSSWTFVS